MLESMVFAASKLGSHLTSISVDFSLIEFKVTIEYTLIAEIASKINANAMIILFLIVSFINPPYSVDHKIHRDDTLIITPNKAGKTVKGTTHKFLFYFTNLSKILVIII